MTNFIDAKTSQNASYANSIEIPILTADTPQLFGQVGLITQGAGKNVRVLLKGTVAIQAPLNLVRILVTIVRGTQPTDPLVYSARATFNESTLNAQVITFSADDFNPPVTPQLTYTAFVQSDRSGAIRIGPENLDAILVSD